MNQFLKNAKQYKKFYSFSNLIARMANEPKTQKGFNNVAAAPAKHSHDTTFIKLDDVVRRSEHCEKCLKTVYRQNGTKVTMK
jgi:hypothetical protein